MCLFICQNLGVWILLFSKCMSSSSLYIGSGVRIEDNGEALLELFHYALTLQCKPLLTTPYLLCIQPGSNILLCIFTHHTSDNILLPLPSVHTLPPPSSLETNYNPPSLMQEPRWDESFYISMRLFSGRCARISRAPTWVAYGTTYNTKLKFYMRVTSFFVSYLYYCYCL